MFEESIERCLELIPKHRKLKTPRIFEVIEPLLYDTVISLPPCSGEDFLRGSCRSRPPGINDVVFHHPLQAGCDGGLVPGTGRTFLKEQEEGVHCEIAGRLSDTIDQLGISVSWEDLHEITGMQNQPLVKAVEVDRVF